MVNPYTIRWSSRFRKDYKKMKRQGKDMAKLDAIIASIATRANLPESQHDHELSNNWAHHRECHIAPDWLLIYEISDSELYLYLTRAGTHSDLF